MRPPPKTSMPSAAAFSELRLGQGEKLRVSTYDIQDCFYQFKIPKAFGELFGFKRIQAYKLGCRRSTVGAVAPLDWVTPVCAVLPVGCSWALHFCQQAHVNIALRTGLGRHRLLFDKTPAPLLSDAEPAVFVYVDNGGILSTQRGKANTLRRQLERKLGEVALPTHEAEAETDDLEMLGMRLHDARAAPTRKRAWRLKLATEELLKIGFRDGGANGFAHRSLYRRVPLAPPVPVGLLHSLSNERVSGGDPSGIACAESCKQLAGCWCSPSPICHSRSSNRCTALTRARRDGQLTLGSGLCKRLNVNWLGTRGGASSGLKGSQPGAAL